MDNRPVSKSTLGELLFDSNNRCVVVGGLARNQKTTGILGLGLKAGVSVASGTDTSTGTTAKERSRSDLTPVSRPVPTSAPLNLA